MRVDVFHHYPDGDPPLIEMLRQLTALTVQVTALGQQVSDLTEQVASLTLLVSQGFERLENDMSELSTSIDAALASQVELATELQETITAAKESADGLKTTIDEQSAEIARLSALVQQGTATPEDIAKLQQLTLNNQKMTAALKAIQALPVVPVPVDPNAPRPDHTLPGDLPDQPQINPLKRK